MTKGILCTVLQRATLALAIGVVLFAGVGSAEEDHLLGFKVTDADKIQPGAPYDLVGAQYGTSATQCELKKAKFMLVQAEKNGGDDLNGGPPGPRSPATTGSPLPYLLIRRSRGSCTSTTATRSRALRRATATYVQSVAARDRSLEHLKTLKI